jgi:3-hydroxyisobutyrate dehydrogenase-like beta-hydroxyacid dehydrogenase
VVRHSDAITGGPGAIMIRRNTQALAPDDSLRPIMEHTRALGEKDLHLAVELAADLGLRLPMAALAEASLAAGLGVPHEVGEGVDEDRGDEGRADEEAEA